MQSRSMFEKTRKYYNKLWCNKHISKTMYRSSRPEVSCKKGVLGGCSYGNSFPVAFSLTWEKDIISSRSYTKYFPAWARFILASCYVRKFGEKPIFKMGDINLKKNGSVLLHSKISGLDSHFMFGGSSMSIRYWKTTWYFYVFFTNVKMKK